MQGRAFTGAWVETSEFGRKSSLRNVAPSQARGLKRAQAVRACIPGGSRLHRRVG